MYYHRTSKYIFAYFFLTTNITVMYGEITLVLNGTDFAIIKLKQ